MIGAKGIGLLCAGLVALTLAPTQARAQVGAAVELTHARTSHQDLARMRGATLRAGLGRWEVGWTRVEGSLERFDTPCGGFIPPVGCEHEWIEVHGGLAAAQLGLVFSAFESSPVELQWVPHLTGGVASVEKLRADGSRGTYSTERMIGVGSRFGASVRPAARLPLRVVVGMEPTAWLPVSPAYPDADKPIDEVVTSTHYTIGIALRW